MSSSPFILQQRVSLAYNKKVQEEKDVWILFKLQMLLTWYYSQLLDTLQSIVPFMPMEEELNYLLVILMINLYGTLSENYTSDFPSDVKNCNKVAFALMHLLSKPDQEHVLVVAIKNKYCQTAEFMLAKIIEIANETYPDIPTVDFNRNCSNDVLMLLYVLLGNAQ